MRKIQHAVGSFLMSIVLFSPAVFSASQDSDFGSDSDGSLEENVGLDEDAYHSKEKNVARKRRKSSTSTSIEKKHICTICSTPWITPSKLKRHLATHSDTHPYQCNACKTVFTQQASLTYHEKKTCPVLATGTCPVCLFPGLNMVSLQMHTTVHDHEKQNGFHLVAKSEKLSVSMQASVSVQALVKIPSIAELEEEVQAVLQVVTNLNLATRSPDQEGYVDFLLYNEWLLELGTLLQSTEKREILHSQWESMPNDRTVCYEILQTMRKICSSMSPT